MPPEVDTPAAAAEPARDTPELEAVLPDGARLCLFGERVLLVDGKTGGSRQLSEEAHLRVTRGPLLQRFELGERTFAMTAALTRQCLRILALGRLRARATQRHLPLVGQPDPLVSAAIDAVLERDELLLASARTRVRLRGESRALGSFRARAELVISDRRVFLLATSAAGDLLEEALPSPLAFDGASLVSPTRRVAHPAELRGFRAAITLENPAERALSAARAARAMNALPSRIRAVVDAVARQGDASARWLAWFLDAEGDPTLEFPVELPLTLEAPFRLWEEWGLDDGALDSILSRLPRDEAGDQLVVRWATHLWQRDRTRVPGGSLAAQLAFARRLRERGRSTQVREVLEQARRSLPRTGVFDAERPGHPLSDAARQRLDLLSLHLETSRDEHERLEGRLELLRLQPLEPAHLSAIERSGGALGRRAHEVWGCLTQAVRKDPSTFERRTRPLPRDVVERRLRRDLDLGGVSFRDRMGTWLAHEPRPDPALLKQFCERVTRGDAPLVRIVDAAATLLGLGHVDVYLSRGDHDVGVRAFDAARPFLLVGAQHADPGTQYGMTESELAFAVTTELLHLRVGNVRVGTRDVVRGALHKSKAGLDLAMSVLPLLKGLAFADRLAMLTARVGLPSFSRALAAGHEALSESNHDEASGLSPAAERLLQAQRDLQLWADRAGLLCAGSFAAALRAMAITRPDTARAARDFEQRGLLAVVEEQRAGEPEAFDHLTLRVANLAAFYVSDEFTTLERASTEQPAAAPPND